jgi:hypothetical protein
MKQPSKVRGKSYKKKAEDIREVIPNFRELGMTLQEARFAAEYLTNGLNGTQAYKSAISSTCQDSTAASKGTMYLKREGVRMAISQFMSAWLGERKEKLEQKIIGVLWAQAFYDPADFYKPTGEPAFVSWDEIPAELRVCVESIETKQYGQQAEVSRTVMKLVKRDTALERLARYIALFSAEEVNHNLNLTAEAEKKLNDIFNAGLPKLALWKPPALLEAPNVV